MQWDGTKNSGFSTGNHTWLPLNENYTFINVKVQRGQEESHYETYKKISLLRKSDAWKYGSLETKSLNSGNVFAFSRYQYAQNPIDKISLKILILVGFSIRMDSWS